MRFGVWALAALTLGAFAAHFVLQDRGYVLINFRSYVVEMSVPGLVLTLVALYALIRGLATIGKLPRRLGGALAERRLRRSGTDLTRGLVHMIEGDWARGERLLTQRLKDSDAPLVNYVLAARAAHLQGAYERRDEWLKLAHDESPNGEAAVLLIQAELQLDAGQHEQALATLNRLTRLRPDHPGALGLLARVYEATHDQPGLTALLPRLDRARLPMAERESVAGAALDAEFARPGLTKERLTELWSQVPSDLRVAPALLARRALALERLGRGDDAERELRAALKRNWHVALVKAYGEVRGADLAKQLQQAEGWLRNYPEDGTLLLTAARLCMANELWGKARSYLESSLALAPGPDAYAQYGRLLGALGEEDRAALAFRSGLGLVSPTALERLEPPPRPSTAPASVSRG